MALITCQNLSLGYDGREIVHDLNFAVHAGEYLCIVGENGSGKSTLMRTILGLQAPLGGSVLTGDGLSRTEIGYLPQQTVVQRDFPATVWEIVLSGCQGRRGYHPFYSGADKERARENIRKMGISTENYAAAVECGGAKCFYVELQHEKLENEDWTTAFSLENMNKDLGICLRLSEETGFKMPGVEYVKTIYDKGMKNGLGKEDFRATYKIVRGDYD